MVFLESMDWFYLFLATLSHSLNMVWVWAGFLFLIAILTALPFLFRKNPGDKAIRDLAECNGCMLCAKDCPYDAISMLPRTDGKKVKFQPEIDLDRCAGCGICAGACNFEAIGLKSLTHTLIEKDIVDQLGKKEGQWAVFLCNRHSNLLSSDGRSIEGVNNTAAIKLPCTGMIGPVLVEKVQQLKAKGIIISSCPEGDCQYREGNEWIQNRILKKRKPLFSALEESYPVFLFRFNSMENHDFVLHAKEYIAKIENQETIDSRIVKKIKTSNFLTGLSVTAASFVFLAFLFYFGAVSNQGAVERETDFGLVKMDFFYESRQKTCSLDHIGDREYREALKQMESRVRLDQLSEEARKRIRESARNNVLEKYCSRERLPVQLTVLLDGKIISEKIYKPAGIKKDGIVYVLDKNYVSPGIHEIHLKLQEMDGETIINEIDFQYKDNLESGNVYFLDFDRVKKEFFKR
ncbi:MAG: hydrogenase iron-sulfur subunit, partial [Spirochaetia bacterium]|nr:hydrogenase iron-sulfur subunit [Spirochaetia bacterium]